MQKSTTILYHGNCPDGFTAAWAAWKKLGARADYFAVRHQTPPPKDLRGKTVYLLDFSYTPDTAIVEKLTRENKSVVILDHHQTAEEGLKNLTTLKIANFQFVFDNNRSGAHLAWDYFHPGTPPPKLVSFVEDFDLWKFQLPLVKEVSAFLEAHDFDFKTWNRIANLLENPGTLKECAGKGKMVLAYQKNIIKDIVSSASEVSFEGRKTLATNCPILRSEIGHELALKKPPFSIVWREKGGQIHVSLRGAGDIDLAKIAEKYGGGGHRNAAGFVLKKGRKIPWKT